MELKEVLCRVRSISSYGHRKMTTQMFLPQYDSKYEIYSTKEDSKRRVFALRHFVCLFIAVCILGGLLRMIISHGPTWQYDRKHDNELLNFVFVSQSARSLPRSGQLMCWVMTSKSYHDTRAIAINETWLHRCDHGQLFTNDHFDDQKIPYSTVFAGIPDTYDNLFFKSRYAFHYIYNYLSPDFEWYLKADDDTYIIVEHLKEYLSTLDPRIPYYIGYRLRPYLEHGYNAGGAGYVLSKAALKIFSDDLYSNETLCPDDKFEDVGIGRCLANVGIFPYDTRNEKGQQRFNTFTPMEVFHGSVHKSPYWIYDPEITGFESVGGDLISFHHLSPDDIRLFEIMLYRVKSPMSSFKHRQATQPEPEIKFDL